MKSFAVFFITLVIAATIYAENEEDMRTTQKLCNICPEIYKPVCGNNGQCSRWFQNQCTLRQFNCLYQYYYGTVFTQCDDSLCQQCCQVNN